MAQPNYTMPEYMVNPGGSIAETIQRSRALSDHEAAQKFAQQQDMQRMQMEQGRAALQQQVMESKVKAAADMMVRQNKYNSLRQSIDPETGKLYEPYKAAVQSGAIMPRKPTGPPTTGSVDYNGSKIPFVSTPEGKIQFPPSAALRPPQGPTTNSSIKLPDGTDVPFILDPRGVPHFVPSKIASPGGDNWKTYDIPGEGVIAVNPKTLESKTVYQSHKMTPEQIGQEKELLDDVKTFKKSLRDALSPDEKASAAKELQSARKALADFYTGLSASRNPKTSAPPPPSPKAAPQPAPSTAPVPTPQNSGASLENVKQEAYALAEKLKAQNPDKSDEEIKKMTLDAMREQRASSKHKAPASPPKYQPPDDAWNQDRQMELNKLQSFVNGARDASVPAILGRSNSEIIQDDIANAVGVPTQYVGSSNLTRAPRKVFSEMGGFKNKEFMDKLNKLNPKQQVELYKLIQQHLIENGYHQ